MAKLVFGFGAAILLGGGGAAALNIMADDFAPVVVDRAGEPRMNRSAVEVVRVEGEVKALMPDGEWRYVRHGFALNRPTGIEVVGPGASATVRFQGVTLEASVGAKVLIGAPGAGYGLQLENGRIVVSRSGKDITTFVPRRDATVRGPAYGVWVMEDSVAIAVLEERAEIEHRDEKPIRYGRAREVLLTKIKATPSVLNERLEITTESVNRRGRSYRYNARTAPRAVVMKKTSRGYEPINVSISGTFAVDLPGEKPEPGELVAYDAAGRRAELGSPSRTLEEVIDSLSNAKGDNRPVVTRKGAEAIRTLGDGAAPPAAAEPQRAPPVKRPPPVRRAEPAKTAPPPPARAAPPPKRTPPRAVKAAAKPAPPMPKLKPAPKPKAPPAPEPVDDEPDDVDLMDTDDEIDEDEL